MRTIIKTVKQRFKETDIIGAEIGVFEGTNAKNMLDELPNLKKLYLIDPYEQYEDWSTDGWYNKIVKAKNVAMETIKPYKNRTRLIMKKTEDIADEIPPNSLDFVYIDGNHEYEYVKKDLMKANIWVKEGGIIGGHDFAPGRMGVIKAVLEFCKERNITFSVRRRDWWFTKKN